MLKIGHFTNYILEFADEFLVVLNSFLELIDLSLPKGFHEVIKPLKLCSDEHVNNVFIQQLGNIKDLLSKEDWHAHFDGELFLLFLRDVFFWCVGKVLELTFVVVFVVIFSLVVQTVNLRKTREHLGINVLTLSDVLLNIVQLLNTVVMFT